MRKNITPALEKEIKEYYLSYPMTLKQVEDKFNLSHPTISKILKDVPKYTKAKINSPNLKEDFFHTIDSEEKAYFIGLLISDGNVFKDTTRQASISITLDLEDEYSKDSRIKKIPTPFEYLMLNYYQGGEIQQHILDGFKLFSQYMEFFRNN